MDGFINDHLIDGSWYGDNTDQRGTVLLTEPIYLPAASNYLFNYLAVNTNL
jgi:hypothetical protein